MNRIDELTSTLLDGALNSAEQAELLSLLADSSQQQSHLAILNLEAALRGNQPLDGLATDTLDEIQRQVASSIKYDVMRSIAALPAPAWQADNGRLQAGEVLSSPVRFGGNYRYLLALAAGLMAAVVIWKFSSARQARNDLLLDAASPVVVQASAGVRVQTAGSAGVTEPLTPGRVLRPGESLVSDTDEATVRIKYLDGTRLSLTGHGRMGFSIGTAGQRGVQLFDGVVRVDSTLPDAGNSLKLSTPNAEVLAGRSQLHVAVSAQEGTRVDLAQGSATLSRAGEEPVAVEPGRVALVPMTTQPISVSLQPTLLPAAEREIYFRNSHRLRFTDDGASIVAATPWQAVYWSADDRVEAVPIRGRPSIARSIMEGSNVLVSSDALNEAFIWNTDTRNLLATLPNFHTQPEAVSPRGDWAARFEGPKSLVIHNVATGEQATYPQWSRGNSLAVSPDGTTLAMGRQDIRLIDPLSGELRKSITLPSKPYASLAYSRDGQWLVCGTQGNVHVYDLEQEDVVQTFRQPGLLMQMVAISADRQWVAAAHEERVWLWDVATGQEIALIDAGNKVRHFVFSPDGSKLATVSGSGQIAIWSLKSITPPVNAL